MSTGLAKPGSATKPGQAALGPAAPSTQAILREKLNRRATPDSEALASSDDEGDLQRQDPPQPAVPPRKPVRRASWLNDTTQPVSRPRKGSFASSSMSPTTSHPSTPSAESGAGTWGSHSTPNAALGRTPGSAGFSWGTGIWNNDKREAPSRLAEVLPSPTSTMPPGATPNSFFGPEIGLQTSPGPRDQSATTQIPFPIPLHPTPKTYRSQSYSVGQLEADAAASAMMHSTILPGGRGRAMPHSALQHRPSRPSMLSEMSSDGSLLGKVKEVEDDDDESTTDSMQGSQHQSDSKTIEMLTRENAILRQQQYVNSRIRPRASTAAAYGLGNGYALRETVPEESDYAIDELDESNDAAEMAAKRGLGRRLSEFGPGPFRSPYENRKLENVKKGHWQSSLGFGGLGDIPQSRRHSFADVPVPTRQGSIASLGDAVAALEAATTDSQASQEYGTGLSEHQNFTVNNPVASYFTGPGTLSSPQQGMPPYQNAYPSPYGMSVPYQNRAPSPHRHHYMTQPRHNQLLHIVLFKCARADVFYIQEGTGLTVKPGDLVIVEADRGTDLGTVAKDNVDWQAAKELKEHYAEEQYKWLMMYSQNAASAQESGGGGLMTPSNGLQGSAIGGMGPPNQHHMQEPNAGELKPKLIKRLAQSHEIHALREKEGNEAKAKRVCMQKVKEHGLNMEILDAEFQMDWKKLTFYYFADSYINFNSLVTDLFKIYKTRIWMSAINPASFASPTLGLQAPSGIGPGAVGVGRGGANNTERRQAPAQQDQPAGAYSGGGQGGRGFQAPFNPPFAADRPTVSPSGYPQPSYGYPQFGAFGNGSRPSNVGYVPGMMPSMDSYQAGYPQGADFGAVRGRFPNAQSSPAPHEQGGMVQMNQMSPQSDWVGAFQGLSLNTR